MIVRLQPVGEFIEDLVAGIAPRVSLIFETLQAMSNDRKLGRSGVPKCNGLRQGGENNWRLAKPVNVS